MKTPRILIFKLAALGDLFFTLPAVQTLKDAFPEAEIHWAVSESLAPVLSLFRQINHVIPIRTDQFFGGSKVAKLQSLLSARAMIPSGYDAILLPNRHPIYLSVLVGKGPVFQLVREKPGSLHRTLLRGYSVVPPMTTQESLAIRLLSDKLLVSLGAERSSRWQIPHARASSGKILIHLGGGENLKTEFTLKRWPKMLELIKELLQHRNESFMLVGSQAERADAEALMRELDDVSRIENRVGQTTLPELVKEIVQAKVFIGPDSGPLHIADQIGVPSVGIYGPTSTVSWGLIGEHSKAVVNLVPCHPCYKDNGVFPPCPYHHRCMVGLGVDEVARAVTGVLTHLDALL